MPLLRESDMRARAQQRAKRTGASVTASLQGAARHRAKRYDIFLSQTIRDAELVLGVYDFLESRGLTAFCDWIENPATDRRAVTPANAGFIRNVMSVSDSLLFLDTEKSAQSLWMCWELGWFDGRNGHVAVLPLSSSEQHAYRGREFLGLYPYVELATDGSLKVVRPPATTVAGVTLFEAPNSRPFDRWRKEPELMRPRVL
jgi:hypothetical protein